MIYGNLSVGYFLYNFKFYLKREFLICVFWTPAKFLLLHSLTIFVEFFVNLFQEYSSHNIADNGKSIGEGRATLNKNSEGKPP